MTRIYYTVDLQAEGFPVKFISDGKVKTSAGPFSDPGEASAEFKCRYPDVAHYLSSEAFAIVADGLPVLPAPEEDEPTASRQLAPVVDPSEVVQLAAFLAEPEIPTPTPENPTSTSTSTSTRAITYYHPQTRAYFLSMKSERAGIIRKRLTARLTTAYEELRQAEEEAARAWLTHHALDPDGDLDLTAVEDIAEPVQLAEQRVYQIWKQIEHLKFRLSLVTEPSCRFCGDHDGLSPAVDYRYGAGRHAAIRAVPSGNFWVCGWCFAHVLNGTFTNLPVGVPDNRNSQAGHELR